MIHVYKGEHVLLWHAQVFQGLSLEPKQVEELVLKISALSETLLSLAGRVEFEYEPSHFDYTLTHSRDPGSES
jgi:hypothetical protein